MTNVAAMFPYGWFPLVADDVSEVEQEYDSPSSILARYLITHLEAFTSPTDEDEWPLYDSVLPDFDDVEFDCAAVFDTTPVIDKKNMAGVYIINNGIQMRVRTSVYETGYRKLASVVVTLAKVHGVEVDMPGGQTYEIVNISVASDAVFIGRDEKDRSHFTANLLFKTKVVT